MAFLDDLKKEAEARKVLEQTQTQSKLETVSQNFLAVQSEFREILRYLQELTNQLNVLDLDIKRSYVIEGVGLVDNFRQADYAVSTDSMRIGQKDFINAIYLRFKCTTDRAITIERDNPAQIEVQKDYLWQNNLKYECREYKNDRGLVHRAVFDVTREIPVSIKISADFEHARIFFLFKNFNGLTVNEFTYELNEVTGEFLDEFAKYLVDKPNNFRNLGQHQLKLQNITRTAKRAQEVEYVTLDEGAVEEQEKSGKGLFGKIKSLLA